MQKQTSIPNSPRTPTAYLVLITVSLLLLMISTIHAANQINIVAADEWGIPVDSLVPDQLMNFQIWIENDIVLGGINLGFKVWSPNGVSWEWNYQCETNDGPSFICPVPGSRADDPAIFDLTGIMLVESDVDGLSPDTFLIGAIALFNGLPAGPLEPLYSTSITAHTPDPHYISTICIDSVFVPPSGGFIFFDEAGYPLPPTILWPFGGHCWATTGVHCYAQWSEGLPTGMTVVHCSSNSVTLSASHSSRPVWFNLYELNGGLGEAIVTDNGDGTCEVSYSPASEDVGQEITITVDADCDVSDESMSPYSLSVNVINNPPVLDSGGYFNFSAVCEILTKDDIGVEDADGCDEHEFYIISGPGEIDPVSGLYTWLPGPSDDGEYVVTIGVTDGVESAQGSFYVEITDQDCFPGDANGSGTVDVSDAVYILNYVFRDGPPPPVMNWADANGDCHVNVGDAVRIIGYIFRDGLPPEPGCSY